MGCTSCGAAPCRCSRPGTCAGCGTLPCCCGSTSAGSCCGPNVPPSPTPYYICAPNAAQPHQQRIVLQQFFTTISVSNSWNVPACGEEATLTVVGLKSAPLGASIWNSEFGYFEITAFDAGTGQLTVINNCDEGNAAPGTNVPACTEFAVVAPPCACESSDAVCVAVDFTAPEVDECVLITITNLGTIAVGDEITIGTGRYRVSEINSGTTITICNDGLGITPGTPVIARDGAGNYQYCIAVVASCCSRIEDEFGGDLTPCSNFENIGSATSTLSASAAITTLGAAGTVTTTPVSITINNTSTCRSMRVIAQFEHYCQYAIAVGEGITIQMTPQLSVNGGAYGNILQYVKSDFGDTTVGLVPAFVDNFSNSNVYTIVPSGALTLALKVTFGVQSISSGTTSGTLQAKLTMFGVAV